MRSHGFDLFAEVVHMDIQPGWVSSAELQIASVTRMIPKAQVDRAQHGRQPADIGSAQKTGPPRS
jgi:hypothetical protein